MNAKPNANSMDFNSGNAKSHTNVNNITCKVNLAASEKYCADNK